MATLEELSEKYFDNNKYYKKIVSKNGKKLGEFKVLHFKSTYDPFKYYTSIKAEVNIPNHSEYGNNTNYEFKIYFDQKMSLEDFNIEWEKTCRKWEKVFKCIIEEIEVYDTM